MATCGLSSQDPLKMRKGLEFDIKENSWRDRGDGAGAAADGSSPTSSTATIKCKNIRICRNEQRAATAASSEGERAKSRVATDAMRALPGGGKGPATEKFVRVMRKLQMLWLPPFRAGAAAAPVPAAATTTPRPPVLAQLEERENPLPRQDEGTPDGGGWAPRTTLDLSGHSFTKSLRVEIARKKNLCQQQPAVCGIAYADAFSVPRLVTQRWEQEQQQQQQQQNELGVPQELGLCSSGLETAGSKNHSEDADTLSDGSTSSTTSSAGWMKDKSDSSRRRKEFASPERRLILGDYDSSRPLRASSSASTLPPSPVTAATATAHVALPRTERPPLIPKGRARPRQSSAICVA